MKKAEIVAELKKEFNPELGFFVREDGRLAWNSRALMLWGKLTDIEKAEKVKRAQVDRNPDIDDWVYELLDKGSVNIKIRL